MREGSLTNRRETWETESYHSDIHRQLTNYLGSKSNAYLMSQSKMFTYLKLGSYLCLKLIFFSCTEDHFFKLFLRY